MVESLGCLILTTSAFAVQSAGFVNTVGGTGKSVERNVRVTNSSGFNIYLNAPNGQSNVLNAGSSRTIVATFAYNFPGNPPSGGSLSQEGTIPAVALSWFRAGNPGVDAGEQTVQGFPVTGILTHGGPPYVNYVTLTNASFTVGPGGGVQNLLDPVGDENRAAPVVPKPLASWEGRRIAMPLYVDATSGQIVLEVGGQSYTFDVDSAGLAQGGVAMVDFVVPAGWDGSVKVNGVPVAVAPRVAYTGNPSMPYWANPYNEDTAALPPGMTRGIPAMPAGMTPGSYYGLPAGMTAGTKLPLPSGVSAVTSGGITGNSIPTGVQRPDGSSTWTMPNLSTPSRPPTAVSGGSGGSGGSGTSVGGSIRPPSNPVTGGGSGAGMDTAAQEGAVDAGSADGFGSGGEAVQPGQSLKDLPATWLALKTQIQSKFGGFSPLAAGAIPTQTNLSFTLPFHSAMGGSKTINIDLTQSPFPLARQLCLVIVVFSAGFFFFRWLKV